MTHCDNYFWHSYVKLFLFPSMHINRKPLLATADSTQGAEANCKAVWLCIEELTAIHPNTKPRCQSLFLLGVAPQQLKWGMLSVKDYTSCYLWHPSFHIYPVNFCVLVASCYKLTLWCWGDSKGMKQLAGKLCDIKSTICEQECVSLFYCLKKPLGRSFVSEDRNRWITHIMTDPFPSLTFLFFPWYFVCKLKFVKKLLPSAPAQTALSNR